jgi:hypothetical protein
VSSDYQRLHFADALSDSRACARGCGDCRGRPVHDTPESSPGFLSSDETAFAVQAHAIATTAHDENGRFLPL